MKDFRSRYLGAAKLFALLFLFTLAPVLVIEVVSGQNISDFWTTYQHDGRHSGLSSFIGPQTNDATQLYDLGSTANATYSPSSVVVGPAGLIYFTKSANSAWRLIVLHSDGSLALESPEYPGCAPTTPTIAEDGSVYVPTGCGNQSTDLYALLPDGNFNWMRTFAGFANPVPLSQDGTIYVASGFWQTEPDLLSALNPDGTTKWTYQDGVNAFQPAAVAPNGNVIVSDNGTWFVAAHDPTDGHQLWRTYLGSNEPGTMSAPSVAPDGTIYIFYNRLWAISPNGQIQWATQFISPVLGSTPTIAADGSVLFATSNYGSAGPAELFSYTSSGQLQWSAHLAQDLGFSYPQVALDAEGAAYVTFSSTGCTAPCAPLPFIFSVTNTGTVRWSYSATFVRDLIIGRGNTAYVPVFTPCSDCGFTGTWKILAFESASSPTPTPTPTPEPTPTPTPTPTVTPTPTPTPTPVLPLKLFPSASGDAFAIQALNQKRSFKNGKEIISADIVISNETFTWFELRFTLAGNYVSDNQIPLVLLVGPAGEGKFQTQFAEGQYIEYSATRPSPLVNTALLLDFVTRGAYGVELQGLDSTFDLSKETLADLLEQLNSSLCVPPALLLFDCRDPVCIASNLASFLHCLVENPTTKKLLRQILTKMYDGKVAAKVIEVGESALPLLTFIINVPKITQLIDDTLIAPYDGRVRIECRR